MGRKEYRAHLEQASASPETYGVLQVCNKDSEIEVLVQCQHGPLTVTAVIDETCDYPQSHSFISLYVQDSAPDDISHAIATLAEQQNGPKTIFTLLREISQCLSADTDGDTDMPDSQPNDLDEDDDFEDGAELSDASDDDDFFGIENRPPSAESTETETYDDIIPLAKRNLIRRDLVRVKEAGFRVSVCGPLVQGHPGYLISTCRIAKLGISEEAMQAWQLCPADYLVLLIHYPNGYKHIGDVQESTGWKGMMDFRFGVCSSYKPSRSEVIEAFSTLTADSRSENDKSKLQKLFIAGPLKDLFCEKFLPLLKCRVKEGMSWDGAMAFWHDHHATEQKGKLARDPKYQKEETSAMSLPALVTEDHVSSFNSNHAPGDRLSLPLVAMQFYVRQLVRCTEFCLICHRKMPGGIEAIKPYVCESQLCLYQYSHLGFGPSIEHEIISQPAVVDLLVSLCWAAAKSGRLKQRHLPLGLGLRVPRVDLLKLGGVITEPRTSYIAMGTAPVNSPAPSMNNNDKEWLLPSETAHATRLNLETRELLFETTVTRASLNLIPGDWIQLRVLNVEESLHCKVEQIMLPIIKLSKPIVYSAMEGSRASGQDIPISVFQDANFVAYDKDLDSLDPDSMQEAVVVLLDLLPTVKDMREFLLQGGAHADLTKWPRITSSSLGLLRWIVASNRACIMQIGDPNEDDEQDHVWGMPGWKQFRIAMGAPDKERRFIDSVSKVGCAINPNVPTIFAWHGSSLFNWHSIIREGLNFEETMNGRAFGHGVYLSKDLTTSLGYSRYIWPSTNTSNNWRSSELAIHDAISLNEVVNAPSKFVSSNPHFVVDQIDWIQTRYLFVHNSASRPAVYQARAAPRTPDGQPRLLNPIVQDSTHFPINIAHEKIEIPASATRSRAKAAKSSPRRQSVAKGYKKLKTGGDIQDQIDDDDDDVRSEMTDQDDCELLQMESRQTESATSSNNFALTDFVPGQLDFKTLEILPSPEGDAASISASRRLQADLNAIRKVQGSQPLHELGWYIDPEHTDNLYQWIVELHSFEPNLPLAQDMKAKGVKSVVLELTFGKDYPFAPPFVRVIRPRFLPFQQGGGGHVTAGGALCMELLTNDGWNAVNSIESVLMQVRLAISSREPRYAKLDPRSYNLDYGIGEAVEAYIRACDSHGWKVPPGFRQMVWAGRSAWAGRAESGILVR